MYNHNKAQQSKNRVHISWDILYIVQKMPVVCSTGETRRSDLYLGTSLIALLDDVDHFESMIIFTMHPALSTLHICPSCNKGGDMYG